VEVRRPSNRLQTLSYYDSSFISKFVLFFFFFHFVVYIIKNTKTATLGNALTYVYPAMMYSSIVKKQNRTDQSTGVLIANISAVLGVVMGIIGTYDTYARFFLCSFIFRFFMLIIELLLFEGAKMALEK
jgi:hypothetical protein